MSKRINVDEPLWDQNTFLGRFYHFAWVTDPRSCFCSEDDLFKAKTLVEQYRKHEEPTGTTVEQITYAKKLYESAFHPDTQELQNIFGRMSFQLPGGMAVTGAMLQFYRTTKEVIFWQWVNQSFNACVNYTNRNANSPLTVTQLGTAYVTATASAMVTAIGLKKLLANAPSVFQRYVPFAAVAAANCANIPLMRQSEIIGGVDLIDENGKALVTSKYAAVKGISQVVLSRIVMCAPGMLILPIIMERLEKYRFMQRITFLHMPIQVGMVGCFLTLMVPVACAIFPQKCGITPGELESWEPVAYQKMLKEYNGNLPNSLYFNKGL